MLVDSLPVVISGWVGFHTIVGDAFVIGLAPLPCVVVIYPHSCAPPLAPDYSPPLAWGSVPWVKEKGHGIFGVTLFVTAYVNDVIYRILLVHRH